MTVTKSIFNFADASTEDLQNLRRLLIIGKMSQIIKPEGEEFIDRFDTALRDMLWARTFMGISTVLHETPGVITVYEHPISGQTAPIMVYIHKTGEFINRSPFWDCDCPEEIIEWANERA
jgi:hypothetical protein